MNPKERLAIVHPEKHIPLAIERVVGGIQPQNSLETREAWAAEPKPDEESPKPKEVIRTAVEVAIGYIPGEDDPDPSRP